MKSGIFGQPALTFGVLSLISVGGANATVLPSCLLAGVGRLMTRFTAVEWVSRMRKALVPIGVGFMLASGYVMSRASYDSILSLAIVAAAAAMIFFTRRSPLVGIAAGALLGIVGHRLHAFE